MHRSPTCAQALSEETDQMKILLEAEIAKIRRNDFSARDKAMKLVKQVFPSFSLSLSLSLSLLDGCMPAHAHRYSHLLRSVRLTGSE